MHINDRNCHQAERERDDTLGKAKQKRKKEEHHIIAQQNEKKKKTKEKTKEKVEEKIKIRTVRGPGRN